LILLPEEHTKLIQQAIQSAQAAGDLPEFDIPDIIVQPPKRADQGDYACPSAMAMAKLAKRKPLDIAQAIANHLPDAPFIGSVEVAPPGFINFRLDEVWLKQQVETIIAEDDKLFQLTLGKNKRAQVEFVSANPSGPITIGHTRNAVVGDTVARLLEAAGYDVEREYYFNNAGNQMVLLGQSLKTRYLQQLGHDIELQEDGYQGEYLIDFSKQLVEEQGDKLTESSWEVFKDYAESMMFEWIKKSLDGIGIQHDNFFNENSLYDSNAVWDTLEALREKGYIYEAKYWEGADEAERQKAANYDPAQWFRTTSLGDEKDRVMVKSDGSATYTLPDIAYHKNKIERGFDIMVNLLGSDHLVQAQVVRYGVQALGLDPSGVHVIIIQMVHLIRGGERVKMSKRKGNFETLDDLVEQTSADVVRYMLLARSPNTDVDFDLDLAVKQSNENPVFYIQNAHVRCAGIFREAEARGMSDENADLSLLGEDEMAFIRKVLEMGDVIKLAVENFEPHKIAFYAHELASTFHPIYDRVRALHGDVPEDVAKARLRFYRAAQVAFKRVLNLMGMTAPERM